jgi:hypothetical protein
MLWSGSSPLTVMRDSMWGFLMFAGAAWLAIAWTVLRLEPVDVVSVAGPVLLFGALCEAVRALAGTKTWWLNAAMAALFAATGAILLADRDSSFTTPASLIGWFLMVRGAVDVAVSTMNRGTDRTWPLIMTLGALQAGLGFFSASPAARSADLVLVTLGGVGLLRGIADLVTSLRLREVSALRHGVLHLPPEREAGVAGYSAGLTDYDGMPAHARPRHRATPPAGAQTPPGGVPTPPGGVPAPPAGAQTPLAGAPAAPSAAGSRTTPEPAAGRLTASEPAPGGSTSFHDEVVRTTADLDTMIAQAGVSGVGTAAHRVPENLPPVPDTPEGVASREEAGTIAGTTGQPEFRAGH